MELFLALVALAILGYCVWPKAKEAADVNDDGKVDVQDAKVVVAKVEDAVVAEAKEAAAGGVNYTGASAAVAFGGLMF